jgi:ParB-like chromosome segregation protein Spo0J
MTYTVHPAAAAFPMMNDAKLNELAEDIKQHGLLHPIVLNHDETILIDGRNRLRACEIADLEFRVVTLPEGYTDEQIINYVVSANERRRHLTPGQKAAVAYALEPMYAEAAKERMLAGVKADPTANSPEGVEQVGEAREQAAKAVGSSGRSVSDFKALSKDAPDLAEKVRNGQMTLNAATKERQARKPRKPSKSPKPPKQHPKHDEVIGLHEQGANRQEIADSTGVNPRSVDRVVREERIADNAAPAAWDTIPGTVQQKLEREKRRLCKKLEKDFDTRLLAQTDQYRAKCDQDVAAFKAELERRANVANDMQRKQYEQYQIVIEANRAKGLITPDDWTLIVRCLHPDNSASEQARTKAFRVFNDPKIKTLLVKEV